MVIQCPKCEHIFKSKIGLTRHLNRKNPCIEKSSHPQNIINIENKIPTENINQLSECLTQDVTFDELPKFDERLLFADGQEAKSLILSGSRKSGKTTIILYLYERLLEHFDIVVFFSFSLHNDLYANIQEPKFDRYNSQIFEDLFYFQKKTKNAFSICVLMDDMIGDQMKNDDGIMNLYVRGRNSNISVLISTQHMNLMRNTNRANCSFIIFGKTNSPASRLTLIEDYLLPIIKIPKELGIKTKTAKIEYLDQWVINYTKDHNFIVIDYYNDGENIYQYKVPYNDNN